MAIFQPPYLTYFLLLRRRRPAARPSGPPRLASPPSQHHEASKKLKTLTPNVDVNLGDPRKGTNKSAGDGRAVWKKLREISSPSLISPDRRGVEESDHHIHVNAPPYSRPSFHCGRQDVGPIPPARGWAPPATDSYDRLVT